jgi:AraC family transcriptional regulator
MPHFHGRIRCEATLGPITITHSEYDSASLLPPHGHPWPYISILLDGQYTEVIADVPRLCWPGTAIFHRASEIHADYFHLPGQILNVEFERPCSPKRIANILGTWLQSCDELPFRRTEALLRAVSTIGIHLSTSSTGGWLGYTIARFDWASARPLQDAARVAGIHPTHFSRAFHRYTGLTPSEYRKRERVRAASQLLLGSKAALSSIAIDCGFNDQSHFTNTFRQVTGMPPAKYRRVFRR